ncbi:hypothetical protein ASE01_21245 [Nocardioides sp. Root190]|uniref:hypothetical protein n=1 Tax=Nocardioides sp. Root190 TaxID=1736488 RepID=UPI00070213EA|nr:hypothetical protein [Nocardioides sp. Root190]KRB73275.1 hypothetical protein ASE01_21245 [Nocardioides sp. Root190]
MVSESRAAVVKVLKARGAKARKGHLRIPVGDLFWYVDPRVQGVGRAATLRLEVGCWLPDLPPEPDGGAVDCPLLMDVDLGEDPAAATEALVDLVSGFGDLGALRERLDELPGALVDRSLRQLLG